jgi:HD superfamily phosphodiesterase
MTQGNAFSHGIHRLPHWLRVERNGLDLAATEGGDSAVVSLFALFHDSRRLNDDADPDHGSRGAGLVECSKEGRFAFGHVRSAPIPNRPCP